MANLMCKQKSPKILVLIWTVTEALINQHLIWANKSESQRYNLENDLQCLYTMHNKFSKCFVWMSPSTSDLEFHLLS